MVLHNRRFPKLGLFLARFYLDTQVRGNIGKNVSFSSSLITRKSMVEMLYGSPQCNFPQYWFLYCSIVSMYSTTMTKLMFPLISPQFQEKQWRRCSMVLLNQRFSKLGFFLAQLILTFFLLNVYHASSNP